MNLSNLTDVVHERITEDGVMPITTGNVVAATVRENLRMLLKRADPEGYEQYRLLRYPNGEGSDTQETRVASMRFLFDRSRDLLTPFYLHSKELCQ